MSRIKTINLTGIHYFTVPNSVLITRLPLYPPTSGRCTVKKCQFRHIPGQIVCKTHRCSICDEEFGYIKRCKYCIPSTDSD